ncbi:MAG: DUF456 domain-containing protein [Gammaproteobacteria bacterium]
MNFDPAWLLWLLALTLIAVGLIGIAVPALPGPVIIFLGLFIAAWTEDFQYVGTGGLILLGILAALAYLADFLAGIVGAKKFGASNQAMIGAGAGAFIGIFFGIPGIILGPFLGAMIGELMHIRELAAAGRAGLGATVGLLLGTVAKLVLAFMMIGLFAVFRLTG